MHSAARTLIEVKVRRPCRVSQVCTAEVARIIGIAIRSGPTASSVRIRWPTPARTASSASWRTRVSAARSASRGASVAMVQSITRTPSATAARSASNWPFETTGLSMVKISVWLLSWSSTFLRLPNRVFRLITRCSRKLSIAGLVTWLKFCRKKWLSGRYWSDSTATGVSSPMLPSVSLASSAIGCRMLSSSSTL